MKTKIKPESSFVIFPMCTASKYVIIFGCMLEAKHILCRVMFVRGVHSSLLGIHEVQHILCRVMFISGVHSSLFGIHEYAWLL